MTRRSSSAVSCVISARPSATPLVGSRRRHAHLLGDLPIGVAHQAIFHRLLDLLLAIDLGLGRVVALLTALSALALGRRLVHFGALIRRLFLGLWTTFGLAGRALVHLGLRLKRRLDALGCRVHRSDTGLSCRSGCAGSRP